MFEERATRCTTIHCRHAETHDVNSVLKRLYAIISDPERSHHGRHMSSCHRVDTSQHASCGETPISCMQHVF